MKRSLILGIVAFAAIWAPAAPLPPQVDVLVAGGTLDAVRAALTAKAAGKNVFLVAPRAYLGEERAATLDLKRHADDSADDPLIREIFNPKHRARGAYNVLRVKNWRAAFKYAAYENVETPPVAGPLDDITTPFLVKRACDRALLAAQVPYLTGMAAVAAEKCADGTWRIACASRAGEQIVAAKEFVDLRMPRTVKAGKGRFLYRVVRGPATNVHVEDVLFEYEVPSADGLGVAALENHARSLVKNDKELLDLAECVVALDGATRAPLPPLSAPLPVLADCDVFVAGGGTGGGPAALGAARGGAKTIVAEYQAIFGGVSTEGRIGSYSSYDTLRSGFSQNYDKETRRLGPCYLHARNTYVTRGVEEKGGLAWLGTLVCGATTANGRLTGAIVVLPDGTRGLVRCKAAVDATGNSDLAAGAGAETEYITADELALQGAGVAGQPLGENCVNSDIGFVDETDVVDLCFFLQRARLSTPDRIWNVSSLSDSRERRRIKGMARVTPVDLMLKRTYPDTISQARSRFDTHGQTTDPIFYVLDMGRDGTSVDGNVPYGALLPKTLDGVLVIGLGMSAHRDAMPVLRMMSHIKNQGYAAGCAAAMAVKAGCTPRQIDVKELQRHLVEIGSLSADVLTAVDSFPVSDETLAAAAKSLANHYEGLPAVMSDPQRALPHLRRESSFEAAHIRALLGDPSGADALIAKLTNAEWDEGWNFKGMSQYIRSVSTMDRWIIALGNTRDVRALPVLDALANKLTGEREYSHFRALAKAYEKIGSKSSAAVLARLLSLPGVKGHAIAPGQVPLIEGYSDLWADKERSDALREINVARALYNLGDVDGLGKSVLQAYAADPRRAFANHARLVLHTALALRAGGVDIVVAKGAPKTVAYAAAELADVLAECLGTRPEIVAAPRAGFAPIVLGDGALARAAGVDVKGLVRDAFEIREKDGVVFIAGRDDARADPARLVAAGELGQLEFERGTLFGVYEFLERFAGVRFYFPGELGTVIPKRAALEVPAGFSLVRAPVFTVRNPYFAGDGAVPGETNTVPWNPTAYGGEVTAETRRFRNVWKSKSWLRLRLQTESIPCCHGQRGFDYAHRFHATHPEYFALSRKRPDGGWDRDIDDDFHTEWNPQLCHSSAVWDEFYQDARAYLSGAAAETRGIRNRRGKGFAWGPNCKQGRFVDVMPQDGLAQCHCEKCQQAYVGQTGGQFATELIWTRTAELARKIGAEFPQAIVTQMAYWPYRNVPKCDLPANLWVMVAECGPWAYANEQAFARDLAELRMWYEKLGHKVWMWTYPSKYGRKACPGIPDMAPRTWVKTYRAYAPYSMGAFCEAECDNAMYHYLNYYLYAKLAWDLDLDEEAVLDEHFRLMFGAAAPEMAQFYADLERKWTQEVLHAGSSDAGGTRMHVAGEEALYGVIYSSEVCADWKALFDRAAAKLVPGSIEARRLTFIRGQFLEKIVKAAADYRRATDITVPHPHEAAKNMLLDAAKEHEIVVTPEQKAVGGRPLPQSGYMLKFAQPFEADTTYVLSYCFELDAKDPWGTFFTQFSTGPGQWFNVQKGGLAGGKVKPSYREYVFSTPKKIGPPERHSFGFYLTGVGRAKVWNVHLEKRQD